MKSLNCYIYVYVYVLKEMIMEPSLPKPLLCRYWSLCRLVNGMKYKSKQ